LVYSATLEVQEKVVLQFFNKKQPLL